MCLTVDLRKTQQARRRKKGGFVKRHKIVQVEFTGKGEVRIRSNIFSHTWKPGMNTCGRGEVPAIKQNQDIQRGIHVYIAKRRLDRVARSKTWIEVECRNEDLIAVDRGNEEAYMQVRLTKAEYDRVRNEFTNKLLKNIAANSDCRGIALNGYPDVAAFRV